MLLSGMDVRLGRCNDCGHMYMSVKNMGREWERMANGPEVVIMVIEINIIVVVESS